MGLGARKADGSSFENQCATHGMPLGESGASFAESVKNMGGNPENPFVIFEETKELYAKRAAELEVIVAAKNAAKAAWAQANPELATKLDFFFSGKTNVNWDAMVQKPGQATRAASASVLAELAKQVENMVVASADL